MRVTAVLRICACIFLWIVTAALPAWARVIVWPSPEPGQDFVRRHIASMETKPFDGLVLRATLAEQEGTARSLAWSAVNRRYAAEELRSFVEGVHRVPFRRFRHNFLRVNLNPTNRPFGMFDDESWDVLVANFALAAAASRETGRRGLMVDPEAYAEEDLGTQIPRFNVFDFRLRRTAEEFPGYRREAYLRGQAIGRAAVSAYPGITLILAFGPSATCLGRGALPEQRYSLLGAFADGLLAGAGGQATVIEGFEFSYPYRSSGQFQKAYASLRGPCRDLSLDPPKYDRGLEVGFGLWLDYDSASACQEARGLGQPCPWYDPSLYPVEQRHILDPEEFARAVEFAREVSDGYVWIYTEVPKWWTEEHPLGENLPDASVKALQSGRDATSLSCPRPTGSLLPNSATGGDR